MALACELDVADQNSKLSEESSGSTRGEIIRDYEPHAGVKWRFGRPNYARVNKLYFETRTKKPAAGSAEELVTKVVKNWEVDSHHIQDVTQWKTMDVAAFKASVNGGIKGDAQLLSDIGPYNLLLQDLAPGYSWKNKDGSFMDNLTGNTIFSEAFTEGFAWECLEVWSGPPQVCFKWRHWGKFSGKFVMVDGTEFKGDGRVIELFGTCIATLNSESKITELQIFYNPADMIDPMKKCPSVAPPAKAAPCCVIC